MKKRILPLALSLLLVGCVQPDEQEHLTIMCPTGAPAIAFYSFSEDPYFNTTSNPSLLTQYMAGEKYDIIVAPTNSGISAIYNGSNYKIAATISFGNFYLVGNGNDDNNTIDEGDRIVLFQKGAVPDKIFHYIYGNQFDNSLVYLKDVSATAIAYQNNYATTDEGNRVEFDYILLAEPKVTALEQLIGSNTKLSLRDLYSNKSNGMDLFQASIFVRNSVDTSLISSYLDKIEDDIICGLNNPSLIKEGMDKNLDPSTTFGVPSQIAYKVTVNNNGLGLGYKNAKQHKSEIDEFLSCFGMEATNEEIYF